MRILFLIILVLSFAFRKIQSESEQVQPLYANNVQLKQLSLQQIKGYLLGKWQLLYSLGGMTGRKKNTFPNTTINFTSFSDSLEWKNSNADFVHSRIKWISQKDIFNIDTYIMEFPDVNSLPRHWGAEKIFNDTLILYSNNYDGHKFFLIRKQ